MELRNVDASIIGGPKVLGRTRLDDRRWIYAVEAPFDMPSDLPDLMGMIVVLDGSPFEVRGCVPNMPPTPIRTGEIIELLVRTL